MPVVTPSLTGSAAPAGLITADPATTSNVTSLLFLLLLLAPFIWMITNQRRRMRAAQEANAALTVGDHVVTTSGMFAQIIELDAATALLEVAPGVRIRFDRRAASGRAPGLGTPGQEG